MLDIRYLKLTFNLRITRDTILPQYKTSALRGGMGRMLLNFGCIDDEEQCNKCVTSDSCIIKDIMYPKFEIMPPFLPSNEGVAYIIECFNYDTKFNKGDILQFNLIIFGRTISHLMHFIYAFDALGFKGIGKARGTYTIVSILDEKNKLIYNDGKVLKKNIEIETLRNYVEQRKAQLINEQSFKINFLTAFRYKYNGKYQSSADLQHLLIAIERRLLMMNYFEGKDASTINIKDEGKTLEQAFNWSEVSRYSSTQDQAMKLGGILGTMKITLENPKNIDYILAGELIHVGKNTSFGLGKYTISDLEE